MMRNSATAKFEAIEIESVHGTQLGILHRLRLRWWFWELCGASLSVAAFCATVIILKAYDGHPLPALPDSITLNAIVSVLGTVTKTSLLLVASAAISQFKWLWIHKRSRRLRDLQIFDDASRGPWGAFAILRHSRLSLVSFGALVVLLLLAFDPFVQQVITTPQRDLASPAESTTLHRSLAFDQSAQIQDYDSLNEKGDFTRLMGLGPLQAIPIAVSSGANIPGFLEDYDLSCPSANCTWPIFQTLGLCSTCRNVTEYAQQNSECHTPANVSASDDNRICNYDLPNTKFNYSYFIYNNGTDHEVDGEGRQTIWTTNLRQTTFSNNTFLVVSLVQLEEPGVLIAGTVRERILQATECALAMCVTEYDSSVRSGIINNTIRSIEQPFDMNKASPPDQFGTSIVEATVNGTAYHVDVGTTLPILVSSIQTTLQGNVTVEWLNNTSPNASDPIDGGATSTSPLTSSFYAGTNFTSSVDNMAIAVSRYMRSLSPNVTVGDAHRLETYIKVKWVWISFPALLVASGLTLLFLAILQTERSGVEVWKSSSLPLFFNGPHALNSVREMEEEAELIRVRLGRCDEDGESGGGGGGVRGGRGGFMLLSEQMGGKF